MVAGRSANGRIHWVVEGSRLTYGEWQAEQVNRITGQMEATLGDASLGATAEVGP